MPIVRQQKAIMGQQTMLNRAVTGCKVPDKDMTRESGGDQRLGSWEDEALVGRLA